MNSLDWQTWILLGDTVALAWLGVGAWSFVQRRPLHRLRERLGAEYRRPVEELRIRTKAEHDRKEREKRAERFPFEPRLPSGAATFVQAWQGLQRGFVDNPKGVVVPADRLVWEPVLKRGYSRGDSESRADDFSMHHPAFEPNGRAARFIAMRSECGEASTEDLHRAVMHVRVLFGELLVIRGAAPGKCAVRTGAGARMHNVRARRFDTPSAAAL
jgi:hypothetical protein